MRFAAICTSNSADMQDESHATKRSCVREEHTLSCGAMQNFPSAVVRLLIGLACIFSITIGFAAAPPKRHLVVLGPVKQVSYALPNGMTDKSDLLSTSPNRDVGHPDTSTIKVRALIVDGRQREWVMGESHDVTDRSFTIRRAMRLNDALPGEVQTRWSWQPGPWLLVDRTTGRITALHLPDFDNVVSDAIWYRDYAAYCGVGTTAKGGLFVVVAQLGVRRAVVQKEIGKWPQAEPPSPVCGAATWQREPVRVTFSPAGGTTMTFDVVGAAALVEDGDETDAP